MEKLTQFVFNLLILIGMMTGGIVLAQDPPQDPPIGMSSAGGGGNPFYELCDEPCGDTLRRYFEIEVTNNLSYDIQLFTFDFVSANYVSYYSTFNGPTPSINLLRGGVVPFPSYWSPGLPWWGPNVCHSPYPIVVPQGTLLPQIAYPAWACFPIMIPANTTYYLLAEMNIIFDCPVTDDGDTLMMDIPRGSYTIDARFLYNDPGITGQMYEFDTFYELYDLWDEDEFNQHAELVQFDMDFGCDVDPYQYRISTAIDEKAFSLAPSVTSNNTILSSASKVDRVCDVDVISIGGKKVLSLYKDELFSSGNNKRLLNVSTLPNGIYFVRISSENFTETKKLVVQK